MWADTEGRVSAPTGKVSIGGKSSSVAVREQNSLNIQDALADESGREVSMMDSILVCESDGSLGTTLVHHRKEVSYDEVEAGSHVTVCGKKDAESSSTTGSSTGCLQECPGQALSQPGRGVGLSGDKTENQEGVHVGVRTRSAPANILSCVEADQSTPDVNNEMEMDINSCANVSMRATCRRKESIRERKLPKINGTYIEGLLNGLEVTYTVDGAATDTMVSTWVYKKIPEDIRPRLQPGTEDMASGAGGGDIRIWGRAKFKLQLGPVELIREVVVAEIIDDVLLGDDILRRDHEGPMDILNSKKIILFRGQEIPLLQVGLPKRAFRISTIDDEVIPGMTKKIVNVFINQA